MGKPSLKKKKTATVGSGNTFVVNNRPSTAAVAAASAPASSSSSGNNGNGNSSSSSNENAALVEKLFTHANTLVDQFQYDSATKFIQRILEMDPQNVKALELLSAIFLEIDRAPEAAELLKQCIALAPNEGFSKYFSLAQMKEGTEALALLQKGVEIMISDLAKLPKTMDKKPLNTAISSAYVSMAELYLTDLCFDEDAETRCFEYLQEAEKHDNQNPEVYQSLASYRISQQRPEDAKATLQHSMSLWWQNLEVDPPGYSFRINTSKLLIELEDYGTALDVLHSLNSEDDEVVQVWYLRGWIHYLTQKLPQAKAELMHTMELYRKTESNDVQLLQHVQELLAEMKSVETVALDEIVSDDDDENYVDVDDDEDVMEE